jgi:hypothetical protein
VANVGCSIMVKSVLAQEFSVAGTIASTAGPTHICCGCCAIWEDVPDCQSGPKRLTRAGVDESRGAED